MGETAKERREALVGRKSRRASDWPHGHRWIAPDLSRVAWLGSCQKSTIKRTGLENAGSIIGRGSPGSGIFSDNPPLHETAQIRRGHAGLIWPVLGAPRFSPYHPCRPMTVSFPQSTLVLAGAGFRSFSLISRRSTATIQTSSSKFSRLEKQQTS